jgi:hypothetical protein
MQKRTNGGLVNIDEVVSERDKFSIVLSDRSISKLVASEISDRDNQHLANGNVDGMYEAISNLRDKEADAVQGILIGALHKVYLEHIRHSVIGATLISDNGKHVCSRERCELVPVYGKAYFYEKGRVHICIPACIAPAHFHTGRSSSLSQLLYCCKDSGKAHVCTVSACDSVKHEIAGNIVCRLTGKCLGNSRFSAGWIDDNWRPQYRTSAESRKLETKLMKKEKKRKLSDTLQGDLNVDRNVDRQRLRLLSVIPAIDDKVARDAYIKVYEQTISIAYKIIRPLLPGHFSRDKVDTDDIIRIMKKVITKWTQHARYCRIDANRIHGGILDTTQLQNENAQLVRSLTRKHVYYDAQTFSAICSMHARMVIKYATVLFKYSRFDKYDATLTDFVIALLYIQCRSFRVQDTVMIPVDVFLADHLPTAGNLRLFDHLGDCVFTSTKNDIQACIIESVNQGCLPGCLTYPRIDLSDMLF